MDGFVRTTQTDAVATVTIARPDVHNAFNEVVIAELTEAFRSLSDSATVRVVVLASEGKTFSAGADIAWMKRMVDYSFDENVQDAGAMADMLRAIRECTKPVIARIQGHCYGGGIGLVAACDLAVAIRSAVFCLSEVKLGIIPAVISPYVLEKIGPGMTRRYGLTAERFDGDQAKRIGLVSDAVDTPAALDEWIAKTVVGLKANGPTALSAFKKTLSQVAGFPWDNVQSLTTRRIAELRASPEGQEGLRAFLEKREPHW